FDGLAHGLKLVAVVIVAQAVVLMARTSTRDPRRIVIAIVAGAVALFAPAFIGQLAAIAVGALAGWLILREAGTPPASSFSIRISRRAGALALAIFAVLLMGAVLSPLTGNPILAEWGAFCRSGALVFGGGHMVLPLLQQAVVAPGWVSQDA